MIHWPKSVWLHGIVALVGAAPLSIFWAWLGFRLSAAYFDWLYPHDGQNGLGAAFVFLIAGLVGEVVGFALIFTFQKQWVLRHRPS
jgi:hypothetical protein